MCTLHKKPHIAKARYPESQSTFSCNIAFALRQLQIDALLAKAESGILNAKYFDAKKVVDMRRIAIALILLTLLLLLSLTREALLRVIITSPSNLPKISMTLEFDPKIDTTLHHSASSARLSS